MSRLLGVIDAMTGTLLMAMGCPLFTHEALCSPFQLLALPADCDSARYFQNNNVRLQMLGLNFQHKPRSFLVWAASAEAAEHNDIHIVIASASDRKFPAIP